MLHSIVQTARENNARMVNSAEIGGELVTSGKDWNYRKERRYSQKKSPTKSWMVNLHRMVRDSGGIQRNTQCQGALPPPLAKTPAESLLTFTHCTC
jgi:hypothetical protein